MPTIGGGWAWIPAGADLEDMDIKVARFPWDRVDELRSRAAIHQQPEPPFSPRGAGLPTVALYGTAGKMSKMIAFRAWTRASGGAHALVIFDTGIEANAPEHIPAVFEAAEVPKFEEAPS